MIGILGKYCPLIRLEIPPTLSSPALQGAFVEHETALRRVSSPVRVSPLLVRTQEDLAKCDGLIIPGGGKRHVVSLMNLSLTLRRVDYDCPSGQGFRASSATQGVHKDETCMGYLRRCNSPSRGYRKPQEGWTGAVERNDAHCCTQWLGSAGLSGPHRGAQLGAESCRLSLGRLFRGAIDCRRIP